MNDSSEPDALDEKRERNRQQRLRAIKRWVEYIETHDPEEWGAQQNRLVNSQLESARQSDVDAEHRQRVERAGEEQSS
ncbi:MAG: hypothetical protein ABEH90_00370 [Halolamina sp.]